MNLKNAYNNFNKQENLNSDTKSSLKFSSGRTILLATLFVTCGIMFYIVSPIYREAKIIKFANEVKEKDVELGKSLLLKIIDINKKNEKISDEEVEKIGEFIPNRDNYEDYLAHIINLADNKNIRINEFSISKEERDEEGKNKKEDSSKFNKISISIMASGGFLNFMSFMCDIENGIPFVYEKSISVLKSEENKNEEPGENTTDTNPILDYEMNIEFYYY